MPSKLDPSLGEFEQLVLLAVLRHDNDAYAAAVRRELDERAGRTVSRGALYRTFDRLAAKGLLEWELEDAEEQADRGGLPLRRFRVTRAGIRALAATRHVLLDFWTGLEKTLERP
jgi:PadR family transcriptional regulator PadR